MKLIPKDDYVLLQEIEKEREVTKGGIVVPTTVADRERVLFGSVIDVGRGMKNDKGDYISIDLKAGDKVVAMKGAGDELEIDGKSYILIKESYIVAYLEE